MTMRTKPPYRADQVGSLLRTARVHEAREKHDKGEISAAALKAVEDEEIPKLIKKQEEVGLQCATDGEYRRSWWHFDFYAGLDGAELVKTAHGISFQGKETRAETVEVKGKIGFSGHPHVEHFKFLKEHCSVTPKMTIPSPSVLHYRQGDKAIGKVYPDIDEFFSDIGAAYQKAVQAFYDAGCRYLQIDDTAWAYLCSEAEMARARERGDDVDKLATRYRDCINKAVAAKPADMTITMHICRGNFRSTWVASGGYEPVAETILQGLNIDGYFLEYDSDRAGGFEPLRFLPKGDKQVVLGLVTTKTGALEPKDVIKRRIEEATKFAPLEQFCLSPQCGFASTEEGNELTEDQEWAKLREVVELADEVWG